MDTSLTSSDVARSIVATAHELGFAACGFATAHEVPATVMERWKEWITTGRHHCMSYMERYEEVRRHPAMLLEGARTVISVALNYYPQHPLPHNHPRFAYYAYGRDYHEVMRNRLQALAAHIEALAPCSTRVCCDTAPIFERYWAQQAGIGFVGRNTQLIVPGVGSYIFLGEVITTLALPPSQPIEQQCGACRRCIDACPAHAIDLQATVDALLCLSCQTIENRGNLTPAATACMGRRVYGCDTCQEVCPHNKAAQPGTVAELAPNDELAHLSYSRLLSLTRDEFNRIFSHSAVKRARYEGLMRNVAALDPRLFDDE